MDYLIYDRKGRPFSAVWVKVCWL